MRIAAGVALTLVLAGLTTSCGSSSTTDPEAERELAKAAVLTAQDLPDPWPATGSLRSGTDQTDDQGVWSADLLRCLSVDGSSIGPTTAWASSAAFVNSPYAANSRIEVVASEETAKARIAVLGRSGVADCMKSSSGNFWRTGDPDPADTGQKVEQAVRIADFPQVGDETAAIRLKVSKVNGAGQVNAGKASAATIDVVVVRAGRVLIQLAFGGAPGSLPPNWEKNMTQKLADRAAERLS